MVNGIVADGAERHWQGIQEVEQRLRAAVRSRYEERLAQTEGEGRRMLLLAMELEIWRALREEVRAWPSPYALY